MDQDKEMAKAIFIVMPNTYHQICIWDMYKNGVKHLSHVFNHYKSFESEFSKCIYDYVEEADFLNAWDTMLKTSNLRENTWLSEIYDERKKWALVYVDDV